MRDAILADPTKRHADTVYLIGMSPRSRHLVDWDDPNGAEYWSMNEAYRGSHKRKLEDGTTVPLLDIDKITRWFQMHPDWDFGRHANFNDPNHFAWLTNQTMTCRACYGRSNGQCSQCGGSGVYTPQRRPDNLLIYMLQEFTNVPGSTAYPLAEIEEAYGINSDNVHWHSATFSYMLAMAIHLGFPKIVVRGLELRADEEYANQRACVCFWMGIAIGNGVEFDKPPGAPFLGHSEPLYGYEKLPYYTDMHAEINYKSARQGVNRQLAEVNKAVGEIANLQAVASRPNLTQEDMQKIMETMQQLEIKRINAQINLNHFIGQASNAKQVLNQLKGFGPGMSQEFQPVLFAQNQEPREARKVEVDPEYTRGFSPEDVDPDLLPKEGSGVKITSMGGESLNVGEDPDIADVSFGSEPGTQVDPDKQGQRMLQQANAKRRRRGPTKKYDASGRIVEVDEDGNVVTPEESDE